MQTTLLRTIFDLHLDNAQLARDIQDRVSAFSWLNLPRLLEQGLNQFAGQEIVYTFDRIELDLGTVLEATLEQQLEHEIPRALRQALQDRIGEQPLLLKNLPEDTPYQAALQSLLQIEQQPTASMQILSPARKRLDGIAWFLQQGHLQWNDSGKAKPSIADLLAQALEQSPDQLVALLRRIGQQENVRQRLAHQFDPHLLEQVICVLEPSDATWIIGTTHKIEKVQQQRHIVHDDHTRFQRALRNFVLTALLVERGSYFNTRSYIKSLLQQMAYHYGIAYADLLLSLIAAAFDKTHPAAHQDALPMILLSLKQELLEQSQRTATPSPDPSQTGKATREFLLRSMLGESSPNNDETRSIDNLLGRMSARYGVAKEHLFKLAAGPARAAQQDAMTAILLSLREEMAGDTATVAPLQTKRNIPNFARAAREFVIRGWFEERGSYFNQRSYIKSLLHSLALRHGIAYQDLLLGLIEQTAPELRARMRQTELPSILWSLKDEQAAPVAIKSPVLESNLAFLEHGIVPVAGIAEGQWQRLLTRGLWFGDGKLFVAALRKMNNLDEVVERLLNYLPPQRLVQLLMLLTPGYGGFIHTFLLAAAGLEQAVELSPGQRVRASKLHWQIVLRYLLAPSGETFSLSRFIASCSAEICREWDLPAPVYLASLRAITAQRTSGEARYCPLLDLLERHRGTDADTASAVNPVIADAAAPDNNPPDAPPETAALLPLHIWLRYGRKGGKQADFEARIVKSIARHPEALRTLLLRASGSGLERARIVNLLSAPLRERLLHFLFGQRYALLHSWQAWLVAALNTRAPSRNWQALLFDELLCLFAQGHSGGPDPSIFLEKAIQRLEQEHIISAAHLIQGLDREIARTPTNVRGPAQTLLAQIERNLNKKPSETPPIQTKSKAILAPEESTEPIACGDVFHIQNAGMVLLWPFLERYFLGLNLLDGKRFIDFSAQCRAVHLLQYLCNGDISAPEHDLLFNKILCGLDITSVLEVAGPLSEAERKLSEQLLYSVTQLWEKLKNTSIEGLRETFLIREGRLERKDQGWSLSVAPSAFDVLLASLPWNTSTMCLPWMEGVLWTKWK